ncbi:maleylacetoacetate isomerase [Cladophialophora immunda]|uniref:Maleylacetoacetate isomerase n=1 Tax=Cladophialophora immunda TaxID=569365 RepID=A0A0D2B0E7_9EURO|nr:maleylacetoacetate isomerase [Cladophialophora immunda]KIW31007.1 maleylacetoacetate isomerase [Cladophialophora immunda]
MADTTGAVAHTITLYSSTISDCSARLRIGLHLKRLPYTLVDVNISRNEQLDPKYVDINEALTVPTLVIDYKTIGLDDNEERVVLTQSIAALEYLDEAFPGTHSILPPVSEPLARAKWGRLSNTTSHVLSSEAAKATGNRDWDTIWITRGLKVYEKLASKTAGTYSFRDQVTLADIVLLPELWTASRVGVNLDQYPTISRIFKNLSQLDSVQSAQMDPSSEL